jgi:hypothetical protein
VRGKVAERAMLFRESFLLLHGKSQDSRQAEGKQKNGFHEDDLRFSLYDIIQVCA